MLLAIDTATRFLSIALHDGKHLLAEKSLITDNQHTVQLTPMVAQLLSEIDGTTKDLTFITVSQGPGSFSGLRVGIGMAKGLAMGCNIPLIGVSTLEVVAYSTPHLSDQMVAVVQAGRGRIIAGKYQWQTDAWFPANTPEITTWETLLSQLDPQILINGEIDETGSQLLQQSNFHYLSTVWNMRRAGFLAELGWKKINEGAITKASEIKPLYLKEL